MKTVFIFIIFITQWCYAVDQPEISILTCSPGDEVYSVFGHSAIRIIDKEKSTDVVYNFGIFDFDAPNFTFKFIGGKLRYSLGIQKTKDFIKQCSDENRLVSEQKLSLTEKDKGKLIAKLNFLYRPENRQYLYSFLEKNCSTEISDLLQGLDVSFSDQDLAESNRKLINAHLEKNLWLRFGVNLLLGKTLDRNSNKYQRMFLPIYLEEGINNASLNGIPLVNSEIVLNEVEKKTKSDFQNRFSPLVVFSLLLLIFLFWFPKSIQLLISFLIGATGLILSLMWLFSEHPEVKFNLNVIWCNPLYLMYILQIIRIKSSAVLAFVLFMSIVGVIFMWILNLQSFDIAIIPILFILGIINFKQIKRTGYNKLTETKRSLELKL
ncbi:DUF4105 domain-containing protein [Zunongwangia sp. F260]|uniref:DUF4105 domain-containing protein n=1 Tax=Autumnicola lenta TaxID=3075593 RepID=A0ABU3CKZ3_9FLAO|nr:DUF4105 domain-containing protein [Zunongwangia sp. F260]MDT0647016.1 DUF4105 domain-containing protein [Zunongwangia sp. F260]